MYIGFREGGVAASRPVFAVLTAATTMDARSKDFSAAWNSARKRAGLPELIPHDFRRSAVRNLERAGVPRSAAMKLVAHKTESIYRRYAITDEVMLKEGAEKLAAFLGETPQPSRPKVILLDG